jgi:hypothetical protein
MADRTPKCAVSNGIADAAFWTARKSRVPNV